MERAVTLSAGGEIGEDAILPDEGRAPPVGEAVAAAVIAECGIDLERELAETEKKMLVAALDRAEGVQTRAAKLLGITFRSMRYRLQKHGLETAEPGDDPAAATERQSE